MSLKKRFSEKDLERIKAAVKEAEGKVSGEIVPVFVEKSGYYTIANYRGAMVLASLAFALIVFFDRYVPSLSVYDPLLVFIIVVVAGVLGAIIAHYAMPVKFWLLSQFHLDQSTRKRAENAFLEEEVFNTRHRTGIMIFVSFFEHEVMVMADRGISKVVDQKEWDKIVANIISHIKKNKVADGMVLAIERCAEVLIENGFTRTKDDVNELRDDLRLED
ncbi:MAG: TPM domain-containing protein [Cyclobacteriaceae bacterium]|nr:TPM domain-containing protein [Cyclobacteriaceae bacterium]MCB0498707.1 TPM domain-containing protein [Cyclobacteriaceae bacterium]MCB9237781.1 TPM domain-containing protein [Flammeovirgaceae bacterium]MCO5270118.1 TPM domain-containing protein [Cyclobacteriaceae bacterium]MCW5903142.1 TPM domain-containing protein [Cyclobacteriaceae bacterium]